MKSITAAFLIVCVCYTTTFAQKITADKVPAAVSTALKAKFATADKVNWEMEKGNYEANFTNTGKKQSATFDKSGKWLETETGIAISALPKVVTDGLAKRFIEQDFVIKEASVLDTPDKGTIYEVDILIDRTHFDIQLSAGGAVLNKEIEGD